MGRSDRSPVWPGKRMKIKCFSCAGEEGVDRWGMVYKNQTRWFMRLDCGHRRVLGFTRPPEELADRFAQEM